MILAQPVHRLRDTLGCLPGATDGVLLFHIVFEKLRVIDLRRHARCVDHIDCDCPPVALDLDVLLAPGPPCLVGNVTFGADCVTVFGPVADDAVGECCLPRVRRPVDSNPPWLVVGED